MGSPRHKWRGLRPRFRSPDGAAARAHCNHDLSLSRIAAQRRVQTGQPNGGAADPKAGALAAIALYVAVFPGNVNMVRLWWDKPWPMRIGAIARLPLHIPMITQALKIYRTS
ncbi:MAG: hypothetical protein SV966_02540 [Actinomycetota bacterium]|nr:hypothetical protein [Actinomycetota bacterium]